ncbi:hypothetical protein PoB_002510400 [Plakobranchus ocellatus]|uniref:Uncharacterized protein n=1 Tax=Plakobranchus ocellatus TaxID=259542 RepID=A0AAV3ZVY0_9GAST|nr:hypothetical protein PoB_002510400 [Plakobranchus ocellatus]
MVHFCPRSSGIENRKQQKALMTPCVSTRACVKRASGRRPRCSLGVDHCGQRLYICSVRQLARASLKAIESQCCSHQRVCVCVCDVTECVLTSVTTAVPKLANVKIRRWEVFLYSC